MMNFLIRHSVSAVSIMSKKFRVCVAVNEYKKNNFGVVDLE